MMTTSVSDELQERLRVTREEINQAAISVGRNPAEITLLPVSKTFPPEVISQALSLGEMRFGENKAQELRDKAQALSHPELQWVMIGYLQSNNARYVARYASEIQSLDRLSLAKTLQRRLELENRHLDALVQIKTSPEPSKYGVAPEDAADFVAQIAKLCPRLHIKGLMTMAVNSEDESAVRACFRHLKALQIELKALNIEGVSLERLSMGMSGDFKLAIEEGSTEVRLGTAIFGHRKQQRDYYWPEGR